DGLPKFVRFAENVWGVDPKGKNDIEIASLGLAKMEGWMKDIGLVTSIRELGADKSMLDDLVNGVSILNGGYRVLTKDEVRVLFMEAFKR
ncbi:MAG: NADH-dependent alcohol dehydrogenase, partial [Candidatus Enteromonas sp.]|nr:NADH-dependent alcohol dehydrogenase [Candidatus Enteromonas sp.]